MFAGLKDKSQALTLQEGPKVILTCPPENPQHHAISWASDSMSQEEGLEEMECTVVCQHRAQLSDLPPETRGREHPPCWCRPFSSCHIPSDGGGRTGGLRPCATLTIPFKL